MTYKDKTAHMEVRLPFLTGFDDNSSVKIGTSSYLLAIKICLSNLDLTELDL